MEENLFGYNWKDREVKNKVFEPFRCEDCIFGVYDDELSNYYCIHGCVDEEDCECFYEDDESM